jgi:hypothetical protein
MTWMLKLRLLIHTPIRGIVLHSTPSPSVRRKRPYQISLVISTLRVEATFLNPNPKVRLQIRTNAHTP